MSDETVFVTRIEDGNIIVGDSSYPLISVGRQQARQFANVSRWIGTHGSRMLDTIQKSSAKDSSDGLSFVTAMIGQLDEDALVDMFAAVTGCTEEEAELYFDVFVLVEAAMYIYEHQPRIKAMIDRFFSTQSTE